MIFLSYASEDRPRVLPFYNLLDSHGFDPWMDCKKIIGGQNWDYEIKTALDRADIIVIFISKNSVDKNGYVQREIKISIDKYEEKLLGNIYIIPVHLDQVDFPHLLRGIQFIRSYEGDVNTELLRSIEASSHKAKEKSEATQLESGVRWSIFDLKNSYSGIPGYSISVDKINISSSKYNNIIEISDHINGVLAEASMETRKQSIEQDSRNYNLLQNEWKRTHTFDAIFSSAHVIGRMISICYSMHWYHAGAVHPVHSPKTFNYLLEPVCYLKDLDSLFIGEEALEVIRAECESGLVSALSGSNGGSIDIDWIRSGARSWSDFSNFSFDDSGMNFHFRSYQVACYAAGMPYASVSYQKIAAYLSDSILFALDLHRPSNR